MFEKKTLDSGLRVMAVPKKGMKSVTVMAFVKTGSRYEKEKENGIAHFLEHLFLRGTKKRPSQFELSKFLDQVGGEFNAFTHKGYTNYFVRLRRKHLKRGLDWLADILTSSLFRKRDIEKEKGVIVEERNMYLDTPRSFVWDVWARLLYGDHPLGRLIIGSEENIKGFSRQDFVSYVKKHYTAPNTVVVVAGDIDSDSIFERTGKAFADMGSGGPFSASEFVSRQREPELTIRRKKTDQNHICVGTRGFGLGSERRYSQGLLAEILGGMMSSRLFLSVRARRGLAYYIQTHSQLYLGTGYVTTACGVNREKTREVVEVILDRYREIKEKGVGQEELEKVKEHVKGSLALQLESSNALASFFGKQELLKEEVLSPQDFFEKVDRVEPEDIKRVAADIFAPRGLNLAVIGRTEKKELKKALNKF